MPSPHLDAPDWTGGQNNPHLAVNDSRDQLDRAMNQADSIALSDADYSLTAENQQERGFVTFTGALTADRDITLLAGRHRRMSIENATTGGFNLVVRYAVAGDTVAITPGMAVMFQGDGTNVRRATEPDIFAYPADAVPQGDLDYVLVRRAVDGNLVRVLLDDLPGGGSGGGGGGGPSGPLLHVREEQPSGTEGGASVAGTQTRTLNTVKTNNIAGASLSNNQITLPAGRYFVLARAPGLRSIRHRITMRNITESSTELFGESAYTSSSDTVQTHTQLAGEVDISSQRVFEIRHYFEAGHAVNGLGVATSEGTQEVYTEVFISLIEDLTGSTQSTDDTVAELWSRALAVGEAVTVEAMVNGINSTGDVYSARIFQTARNDAATTSVGTQVRQEIELGSVTTGVGASLVADDTLDSIVLEVTGAASETWDWSATMRIVKQ